MVKYFVEFFDTVTERRVVFKMPYPKFETVEEYKTWAQALVDSRRFLGARLIKEEVVEN